MEIEISKLNMRQRFLEIRPVNPVIVSRYRQHYRAGAQMPPLIVESNGDGLYDIISGNHRCSAMKKEYSDDHRTEVIVREYNNERERLEEFTRDNASHGHPLDGITKKRIIGALSREGATPAEIGQLLNMTERQVVKKGDDHVMVFTQDESDAVSMPVKHGFKPESGIVQQDEYETHIKHDRAVPWASQAGQLKRWVDNGYIKKDEHSISILTELRDALNIFLK